MSEQEFIDVISNLDVEDNEDSHLKADAILLNALRELGWSKLADAYNEARTEIRFWYS